MAEVALTYSYVYFAAPGPHERHPVRSPGGPGGFQLITQRSGGTLQTGDRFQLGVPLPPTQLVNRATYNFAFVNVSGGTPSGAQVSFDNANPPPSVTVASAPINVLAVYVPAGGGGGGGTGGSGTTIDSFDETTGGLFNDIFVSVGPDPGGELTTSGNDLGYVDTTNGQEGITAISPTSSGVIFDQWRILFPPGRMPGAFFRSAKVFPLSRWPFTGANHPKSWSTLGACRAQPDNSNPPTVCARARADPGIRDEPPSRIRDDQREYRVSRQAHSLLVQPRIGKAIGGLHLGECLS